VTRKAFRKWHDESQGLPDFSWCNIPKRGKNMPNSHKKYQMSTTYTKWPENKPTGQKNIPASSIASLSNIYPNYDFWFGNMPSGNPD
jgi:hypothetical protein